MIRPSENGMQYAVEVRLRRTDGWGTGYLVGFRWPLSGRQEGPFAIEFETVHEALSYLCHDSYPSLVDGLSGDVAAGRPATVTGKPSVWEAIADRTKDEATRKPTPGPAQGVIGLGCLEYGPERYIIRGMNILESEDGSVEAVVEHLDRGMLRIPLTGRNAWAVSAEDSIQFIANSQWHVARPLRPSDSSWVLNCDVLPPREALESSVLMSVILCDLEWDGGIHDPPWEYEPVDELWAWVDPKSLTVYALQLTIDDNRQESDNYFRAHGSWFHEGAVGEPRWESVCGDRYYWEVDELPGFHVKIADAKSAEVLGLFDTGAPVPFGDLDRFASASQLGENGRFNAAFLRNALAAVASAVSNPSQ